MKEKIKILKKEDFLAYGDATAHINSKNLILPINLHLVQAFQPCMKKYFGAPLGNVVHKFRDS